MYGIVSQIYPFRQYAYMLYKTFENAPTVSQFRDAARFCSENGIDVIGLWDYWWKKDFVPIVQEYGLQVNLHTVDSAEKAQKYLDEGVSFITTNFLSPSAT